MARETHWSNTKEVISTNRPLKLTLFLIKILPACLAHLIIFSASLFFFFKLKKQRKHYENFRKQLGIYTKGKAPKIVNTYPNILSFGFSIVEKMEGWLEKTKYRDIIKHDDALPELISLLESGKGAFIIGSHLGNLDLLRSLSNFCETGVSRKISVTTVMSMKVTKILNEMLKEINKDFDMNVINSDAVGPDAIFMLQNEVENGGLVVITGDRTSAHSERCIEHDFLGKTAEFPYGPFLIASLLKVPVFFVFALRTNSAALFPKYNIFVEKAETDFNCPRSETKKRIGILCGEYAATLEKYAIKYPTQWYNFFDFWQKNGEDNE